MRQKAPNFSMRAALRNPSWIDPEKGMKE